MKEDIKEKEIEDNKTKESENIIIISLVIQHG